MGFFDFFKQSDINRGVNDFKNDKGAVLVDVRTPLEYSEGHIPGSINVPLHAISQIEFHVDSKDVPLYVYCRSGSRSSQATTILQDLGYESVRNIGGIMSYKGVLSA